MIQLTKNQVLKLHEQLIIRSGGEHGVRDETLLDSALAAPFQGFAGQELYPTIQAKAARLAYGIIRNHPMVDGNKRLGTHLMLIFLDMNGIELDYGAKETEALILGIAAGEVTLEQLLEWVIDHQQ